MRHQQRRTKDADREQPQRGEETQAQPGSPDADSVTERIIGCAIEVHRNLGPGLLESLYEHALALELQDRGMRFVRQHPVKVNYKGREIGELRVDFLVEDQVVVEIKSVQRHAPLFEAQVLTYLRATGQRVGLLLNFNTRLLKEGIKRMVL